MTQYIVKNPASENTDKKMTNPTLNFLQTLTDLAYKSWFLRNFAVNTTSLL